MRNKDRDKQKKNTNVIKYFSDVVQWDDESIEKDLEGVS